MPLQEKAFIHTSVRVLSELPESEVLSELALTR